MDARQSEPLRLALAVKRDPPFERVQVQSLGQRLDDADRVSCIRDLEESHSLAHVMNRTRRRDIGRSTIREPQTVSVPFSEEHRSFYDSVLSFRRQVLLEEHPPQFVRRERTREAISEDQSGEPRSQDRFRPVSRKVCQG